MPFLAAVARGNKGGRRERKEKSSPLPPAEKGGEGSQATGRGEGKREKQLRPLLAEEGARRRRAKGSRRPEKKDASQPSAPVGLVGRRRGARVGDWEKEELATGLEEKEDELVLDLPRLVALAGIGFSAEEERLVDWLDLRGSGLREKGEEQGLSSLLDWGRRVLVAGEEG